MDRRDTFSIVEFRSRNSVGSEVSEEKAYQTYRGQLKLNIYFNAGLLTVHVEEARDLLCRSAGECTSYVKMSLMPDPANRSRHKTAVVTNTNQPMYDDKFSFELIPEDFDSRQVISVWHLEDENRSVECLGCMSFGMKSIHDRSKVVSGWYFLLNQQTGLRKHLKTVQGEISCLPNGRNATASKPCWLDMHSMYIPRDPHGRLGFALAGTKGSEVSRIQSGSSAALSGLKTGDRIVRVDDFNVTYLTAGLLLSIIRRSVEGVWLEVERARELDLLESSPRKPADRKWTSSAPSEQQHNYYIDAYCEKTELPCYGSCAKQLIEDFPR